MTNKISYRSHIVKAHHLPSNQPITLVDYLSQRFTYFSKEKWLHSIKENQLHKNNCIATPDDFIHINDLIEFSFEFLEPKVNKKINTIYEDEALWIVEKSHNLSVHPAGCFYQNTLWYLLKLKDKNYHLVNRLDRETAGLIFITKNKNYTKYLMKQFENQSITKEYFAIVEGNPSFQKKDLQGFIGSDNQSNIRKKQKFFETKENKNLKNCFTTFEVLQTYNNQFSLIKCTPHTGKTHQIRASLLFLKLPLVGDKIYGIDENLYLKFINDELTKENWRTLKTLYHCLQCYSYTFKHPITLKRMHIKIKNHLPTLDTLEVT